jgi:sigma-B regulation protein RsbU (phosphoserine phosphatase)
VGGDYYDYYPLADGRTMIVIGDVAGKGMPAALLVSSLQANASALALTASDLGKFVTQLNKVIRCPSDRFVTFFACIVDAEKEELIFCNAGHNPPLLLKTDGTTEQLPTAGLMLGVFPTVQYKAGVTHFDPGDQLFLYTDGITEAESPEHEEFDVENLEKVLRANAGLKPAELLDQILDRVEQWTNGAPASDDRTMVLVRRN